MASLTWLGLAFVVITGTAELREHKPRKAVRGPLLLRGPPPRAGPRSAQSSSPCPAAGAERPAAAEGTEQCRCSAGGAASPPSNLKRIRWATYRS